MSVRIRMKPMGRRHRSYFRIVAIDSRMARDGKVLEELGTYDPMVKDTDQRVTLKPARIKRWLSVGAQPSEKVAVLLKKYMDKWEKIEADKAAGGPPKTATREEAAAETSAEQG